ncbi:aa3-type cytochrome c oxidase subunit IV [bacterium]|nr:aa3-type cytochrome c oxidase subunit IV [bacterium]
MKTWENFTKFVLWGTISVIAILIVLAIVLL